MTIVRNAMLGFLAVLLGVGVAAGVGYAGVQYRSQAEDRLAEAAGTQAPGNEEHSDGAGTADDETKSEDAEEAETAAPEEVDVPPLYAEGDTGDEVRDLQARLVQIDWLDMVTGTFDAATVAAVEGFQEKRGFPVTGEVDQTTLDKLHEMTGPPSYEELNNIEPAVGDLDPRCREGRVLCIDKTTQSLRWVTDGEVQATFDVRFGGEGTPTREGAFTVESKSRDHVSSLYDTPMPYAMFFSGGQAVHYSSDFAARGYNGASHGCVNVRDRDGIEALFDEVAVGDRVVVYWS